MRRDLDFAVRVTASVAIEDRLRTVMEQGIAELLDGQLYAGKVRQVQRDGDTATVEITAFAQRSHEEPD